MTAQLKVTFVGRRRRRSTSYFWRRHRNSLSAHLRRPQERAPSPFGAAEQNTVTPPSENEATPMGAHVEVSRCAKVWRKPYLESELVT